MDREHDVDRLLAEALKRPATARQAFLDAQCPDDPGLRTIVERLLREADDNDPFLKVGGAFEGPIWQDMPAEPSKLAAGTRLGPYEIRGLLGAGGMGEVYRAHDGRLGRDVAVKVLPEAVSAASQALARFEREARAVAALNHPNILAIHDVGVDGDVRFVVTELLEGETLRQRLARGSVLSPSKAVEYGIQIALGLAAAHDRGIVHRDLKPENLFITHDGRVKILDFGIASFEANAESLTVGPITGSGILLGTAGYSSPEQMLGHQATPRSDLFAFGVVMHEMLTGIHPFARPTAPEMRTAVLREDPPPIVRAVPAVAPAIARLVERCLQKQPADRPETARDVALFLETLAAPADLASAADPAGEVRSVRRLRTRLMIFWSSLVVVLTAATSGYVGVMAERAVREGVEADFIHAERSVRRLHSDQATRLGLTARLVASFPELKALFATDTATIEDFLLGYQQRTANTPVLVALRSDGTVLGRTDDGGAAPALDGGEWLPSLLAAPGNGAVVMVGSRPYLAVAVASEAGGTVFGYLVAAEPINQRFADTVSEATQDEVVLLSRDALLGSTFRAAETPWQSLETWRADGGQIERSIDLRIGSQRFVAREVALADDPPVSALLVKSRNEAIGPYLRIGRGILALGLAALALGILGTFWSTRSPVAGR